MSPGAWAQRRAAALLPGVLAACLLAGCGRVSAPSATRAGSPAEPRGAGAPAAESQDPSSDASTPPVSDADLVSAVNAGGDTKTLSVRFRVEARPVVGMPVKILLALTPGDQSQITHIHGSLAAGDGLLIQSAATFDLGDLKAGTPQYREVTVLPQQTGVLDLSATLLLQSDSGTQARTYSIPLIAADNSSP